MQVGLRYYCLYCESNKELKPHYNSGRLFGFNVLVCVKKGTYNVRTKDGIYSAGSGEAVFVPTMLIHDIFCSDDGTLISFMHFCCKDPGGDIFSGVSEPVILKGRSAQICTSSCDTYRVPDAKAISCLSADIAVASAAREIAYATTDKNSIDDDITVRVLAYISDHLTEKISLSALSEELFFSPSTIEKRFKASTGKSLFEYIRRKRLEYAGMILAENKSIAKTTELLNFCDMAYFCNVFTKFYQMTPTNYLKQIESARS